MDVWQQPRHDVVVGVPRLCEWDFYPIEGQGVAQGVLMRDCSGAEHTLIRHFHPECVEKWLELEKLQGRDWRQS